MRILQLHNHHASPGGAMEVVAHEADLLSTAGHAVAQYTLPPTEQLQLSSVRAGAKAVWNVEAGREVRRQIAAFRPDVVHVHTPFPLMSPAVFRAAHQTGVPTVTTLHSYRYSCIAGTCLRDAHVCEDCVGSRLKLPGVRHACYHDDRAASAALTLGLGVHRALGTFRSVSRYLTLTEFSRRLLIRDGFPADRVQVKPNSVPDPGFRAQPDAGHRRVVFAGRLLEIKGVQTLLDAWSRLRPDAELTVAGDGPLRHVVERAAADDPSIAFLGWVDEDKVADLMASAELVVVPSLWYEGAPLVISRSLAVGTPVLAAGLENISGELLEDDAGWAFAPGDAEALADTLGQLLDQPRLLRDARARARASYERRYAPSVDVHRLERVYRDVAAHGAGR